MAWNPYVPTKIRSTTENKDPAKVSLCRMNLGYRTENKKGGGTKKTELDEIACYRAAAGQHDDKLYLLDIVCSPMEYRAVHACLNSGVSAKFKFYGGGIGSYRTLERDKDYGYRTFHERFMVGDSRANSKIHYLAISNHPSFLPVVDSASVAFNLNGSRFSTPFLSPCLHGPDYEDWVPYIMDKMIEERMLEYLTCHNCVSGFLYPRENVLQQIVSDGVRKGILPWPKFDPREIWQACKERDAKLSEVVAADSNGEVLAEALPVD